MTYRYNWIYSDRALIHVHVFNGKHVKGPVQKFFSSIFVYIYKFIYILILFEASIFFWTGTLTLGKKTRRLTIASGPVSRTVSVLQARILLHIGTPISLQTALTDTHEVRGQRNVLLDCIPISLLPSRHQQKTCIETINKLIEQQS